MRKKGELVLTDKQEKFIGFLLDGKKVVEAWKDAGYQGAELVDPYKLRKRLKEKISERIEADFNKENLKTELKKLMDIPTESKESISVNQKAKLISIYKDILKEEKAKESKPIFTRFQVLINNSSSKTGDNLMPSTSISKREDINPSLNKPSKFDLDIDQINEPDEDTSESEID